MALGVPVLLILLLFTGVPIPPKTGVPIFPGTRLGLGVPPPFIVPPGPMVGVPIESDAAGRIGVFVFGTVFGVAADARCFGSEGVLICLFAR